MPLPCTPEKANEAVDLFCKFIKGRLDSPPKERPITVALINSILGPLMIGGSIFLIGLYWQLSEKQRELEVQSLENERQQRRQVTENKRQEVVEQFRAQQEQRLTLLRSFPEVYQSSIHSLNYWITYLILIAQEMGKPPEEQNQAQIESMQEEVHMVYNEYRKAEPVDGILAQIESTFEHDDVKQVARALEEKAREFDAFAHKINRDFSRPDSFSPSKAGEYLEEIGSKIGKLDELRLSLIRNMAREHSVVRPMIGGRSASR